MEKWTKEEEDALLQGVGSYGLAWFVKHTRNRSLKAVYAKARKLYGEGGLTRGAFTLNRIVRLSGYSPCQFRRAMKALKQKWKRTSAKGSYLIMEDQYDEMISWLGVDYWSKPLHLYRCVYCHKDNRPHKMYGLCSNCYSYYLMLLRDVKLPTGRLRLKIVIQNLKSDYPFLASAEKNMKRGIAIDKLTLDTLYVCKQREIGKA